MLRFGKQRAAEPEHVIGQHFGKLEIISMAVSVERHFRVLCRGDSEAVRSGYSYAYGAGVHLCS